MHGTRITIFLQSSLAAINFGVWHQNINAGLFAVSAFYAVGEIVAWAVKKVKEQ